MQLNDVTTLLQLERPADFPRPSGGPSAVPFYRPTKTNYLSGQTSIYTADCPLTLSGLSAIHLRQPTRDNNASGPISNPTGGLSGPPWRTVRSSFIQSTRDGNVSVQKTLRRTVRSPIADRPQLNPANPTRDNIVSGQISSFNGGPSALQ